MKIAHVINSLNRGGAESHLLELVTAQANSGIIVDSWEGKHSESRFRDAIDIAIKS